MKPSFRDLLGKKFAPHGRGPENYDCYGLAIEVLKRYGKQLIDVQYVDDNREFNSHVIHSFTSSFLILEVEVPNEGDLIVIRVGGTPSHLGVYIGDGKYIHASRKGVQIETMTSIRNKIEGFYRWQQ
jgi:cell wall-associated NlpC family hydrolase